MSVLSEQAFLVLTALTNEPRHGYAIVSAVRELSDGRVELRVGTLYGVLDRLTADGMIELDREEVHQGRLRRYYRPTSDGLALLAEETARLTANATAASTALRLRGLAGGLA